MLNESSDNAVLQSTAPIPAGKGGIASFAPRYQPLLIVLVAACTGIVADRELRVPLTVSWTGASVALGLWLGLWWRRWDRLAAGALCATLACCGAIWHHDHWHLTARNDLGNFVQQDPEPAGIEAIALQGPRRLPAPPFNPMQAMPKGDRTRMEVAVTGIRDGDAWLAASGRARLTIDGHLLGVHAGDRVRIFCQASWPHAMRNPGEFDFAAYARAAGRRSELRTDCPDCVTVLESAAWWNPARFLERLRSTGDQMLWRYLDPRRASLAAALLLGAREELGSEGLLPFMETGTVHMVYCCP